MPNDPTIDLIIVYYNSSSIIPYIAKNVVSISNIFNKVILIDNGSTDSTYEMLKSTFDQNKRIEVHSIFPNRHLGGGIKHGMSLSESEYVGWSHGDTCINEEFYMSCKLLFQTQKIKFIKALRSNQKVIPKIMTYLLGCYASIKLNYSINDISGYPSFIHKSIKDGIMRDAFNDYSFDLFVYAYCLSHKISPVRIPVIQTMQNNNPSSWSRSPSGYLKMIRLWIGNINRVKNVVNKTI